MQRHCMHCLESELSGRLVDLVTEETAREEAAVLRAVRHGALSDGPLSGWQPVHPYPRVLLPKKKSYLQHAECSPAPVSLNVARAVLSTLREREPERARLYSILARSSPLLERSPNIRVTGAALSTASLVDLRDLLVERSAEVQLPAPRPSPSSSSRASDAAAPIHLFRKIRREKRPAEHPKPTAPSRLYVLGRERARELLLSQSSTDSLSGTATGAAEKSHAEKPHSAGVERQSPSASELQRGASTLPPIASRNEDERVLSATLAISRSAQEGAAESAETSNTKSRRSRHKAKVQETDFGTETAAMRTVEMERLWTRLPSIMLGSSTAGAAHASGSSAAAASTPATMPRSSATSTASDLLRQQLVLTPAFGHQRVPPTRLQLVCSAIRSFPQPLAHLDKQRPIP